MENKIESMNIIPANNVLFSDLCSILEQISKKNVNVHEKERILHRYILDFKLNAASEEAPNKDTTFYPILRLLVPSLDRERGAYNMKEAKLASLIVKVIPLQKSSPEAQKLLNRSLNNVDSDFGTIAFFILKPRVTQKISTLTVGDINDLLDKVASAEVGNKGPILEDLFGQVFRNLAPEQIKWFLRIILKDLKLGLSAKRILNGYHPDAPEYYDTCQNLNKTCADLDEGNVRPLEMGIEIFYAVSPMLSERLDISAIAQLHDATFQVEEKFDGERFQIHMENQPSDEEPEIQKHVFEYFSRRGFSFSGIYGKTYDSGLLTPNLKHCFSSHVTSFILDGEMMGWDKSREIFGSKGMAFDVKKLTPASRFQPCFCAFDILYFNGRCLVGPEDQGGMKLSERLKLLDAMFIDVKGVIQHSKRNIVASNGEILAALNHAIANQDEGIVIKDINSYYIANKRNAGWYKIKPEYTEGATDDLDLAVVGADAAAVSRHGAAKSFLLAVADAAPGAPASRWVCVARAATGLTWEQRERVCALLRRRWQLARLAPPPPALVFNRVKPDFWILPQHSIVLQVRATELIRSSDFGTPYTLRFARVKRIRDDKPVDDVMTLDDFNRLCECPRAVIKLSTKRIGEDKISDVEAKTRKKRIACQPQVPEELKKTTAGDVAVTSQALKGRKIFIVSDDEDCTREDLIRIVESHGGKVVANLGFDTWCTVVGRRTVRARNLLSNRDADVASTAWLRALPASRRARSLAPRDLLAASAATRLRSARRYDAYGDAYLELATEDTLKRCFEKMDEDEPEVFLTTQEMLELDRELFGDNNPLSFLRPCVVHVARGGLLAARAALCGATVRRAADLSSPASAGLTHVVVPSALHAEHVQDIKDKLGGTETVVVSEDWLEKCFSQRKLVSDTMFAM